MFDHAQESSSREDRVDEVIAAYLTAVDTGQNSNPFYWLEQHPDLAPELIQFFADDGHLGDMVSPLDFPSSLASTQSDGELVTEENIRETPSTLPLPLNESPSLELAVDYRAFGDFTLLAKLGEGSQGVVYMALQSHPSCVVALKIIRGGHLASGEEVRRFREEADVIAGMDNTYNIVPIYKVGSHQGQWYFTMKLMAGGSLEKRLPTYRDNPRSAAQLLVLLARAVQHAHQHRILHRDLKPSNVLLDSLDQPHLSDFGLAMRLGGDVEMSGSGQIVGTFAYMAPEQASGRKLLTTAVDIHGLGVILYTLLAGSPPFRGNSILDVLEQVRSREPQPPKAVNRKIDRDLNVICMKCLEKDPNRRYATADALAEDLKCWLAGKPLRHARRTGAWERVAKWAKRRPAIAAMLVSIVLITGLGITGIVLQGRELERQRDHLAWNRDHLAWNLYRSRVAGAYREYEAGHTGQALALLDQCDAGLRGWEWDYLKGRRYREPLILTHGSGSYGVAFGRGGPCLASAGDDHSVKVWDAATGKALFPPLRGHRAEVRGVAFSPNGQRLASASWDATVKVWDVSTGDLIRTLDDHKGGSAICVAFSPDGSRLAYGSGDGSVLVYDVETGQFLKSIQAHQKDMSVLGLAYSPDGRWLVSACDDGEIKVWDAVTHRLDRQLRGGNLDSVRGVAFSPDSRRLCAACADGIILLWDLPDGRPTRKLRGHFNTVRGVAFNPDGSRLASASDDRTVKVWDVTTGDEVLTFHGHDDGVRDVAFSPDGQFLASAGEDGRVIVRDATSLGAGCDAIRVISGQDQVSWGVACGPQGRRIAAGGADRLIRVWDSATGLKLLELSGHTHQIYGVAFSPDGRLLASASNDGTVRIWDARAGKLLGTSLMANPDPSASDAWAVAFSPDGRLLASAWGDGTVKLWNLSAGGTVAWDSAQILSGSSKDRVLSIAFSPDGALLASAGEDKIIRIWDVKSGTERLGLFPQEHTSKIYCVAFNHDGTCLASASRDRTVRIWDMVTGKRLGPVLSHTEMLECVAYSPDGHYLAGAGGDGAVRVWDASKNYQEVVTLYGHVGRIVSLAFNSDGTRLVSSGLDKTIRVWGVSCWSTIPIRSSSSVPTVVCY